MQFYVIAPIVVFGLLRFDLLSATLLLLASAFWQLILCTSGVGMETSHVDLYAWLFLIGALSYRFQWQPSRSLQLVGAVFLAISFLTVLSLPSLRSLVWNPGSSISTLPNIAHVIFLMLLLGTAVPFTIGTVYRPSGDWDRWLGDLSYPLYLVHWLPREWYYSQVDWQKGPLWNVSLLLFNLAAAIAIAILLLHKIDRPIQALRRKWVRRQNSASRTMKSGA